MRTGTLLEGAGCCRGRHAYKHNIVSWPVKKKKKVTDDKASSGKPGKLVNFKAVCFLVISPVIVEHPFEGNPYLPWVLPETSFSQSWKC